MNLNELVSHLDRYLRLPEIPDHPRAYNGLQVENGGVVRRIATAVDASQATIEEAVARRCDLLVVHHGLFWGGDPVLTGRRYRRVRAILENDLAVYSAHLPLDVHPEVGNNAVLARELGVEVQGVFSMYQGEPLGIWGHLEIGREALAARLDETLGGRVHLIPGGGERVHRVGVLTGAGGTAIGDAIAAGLDALITGEGAHHTYFDAMEGGLNLYYGGHYATEVWGVRALGEYLAGHFGLPVEFIDLPTGL